MTRAFKTMRIANTDVRVWPGRGQRHVMMVHGVGSNAGTFQGLASALPYRWTLTAWDAPGYGGSAPLEPSDPCANDYAERLERVLREMDRGPVLLVGHSLGTLVAVALAARAPEQVAGLVLLSCSQGGGMRLGELSAATAQRIDDLNRLGPAGYAAQQAPTLFHAPETCPEGLNTATHAMASLEPAGHAQAMRMLSSADMTALAKTVRLRSLILVGAQDHITPPRISQRVHRDLQANAPGLDHIYDVIEGAGHALPQEMPAVVAAHMKRFDSASAAPLASV